MRLIINRMYILVLICSFLFMLQTLCMAGTIEDVNAQITNTTNSKELSKLYTYRARAHLKANENEKANADYLEALDYNYVGYLMNEYGKFLYKIGDYKRAFAVANKSVQDFPHTAKDAEKLKKISKQKYQELYLKNNPQTIEVSEQNIKRNQITKYDLNKNKQPKKMRVVKAKSTTSSKTSTKKSSPQIQYS